MFGQAVREQSDFYVLPFKQPDTPYISQPRLMLQPNRKIDMQMWHNHAQEGKTGLTRDRHTQTPHSQTGEIANKHIHEYGSELQSWLVGGKNMPRLQIQTRFQTLAWWIQNIQDNLAHLWARIFFSFFLKEPYLLIVNSIFLSPTFWLIGIWTWVCLTFIDRYLDWKSLKQTVAWKRANTEACGEGSRKPPLSLSDGGGVSSTHCTGAHKHLPPEPRMSQAENENEQDVGCLIVPTGHMHIVQAQTCLSYLCTEE